jgi:hypothetical protein
MTALAQGPPFANGTQTAGGGMLEDDPPSAKKVANVATVRVEQLGNWLGAVDDAFAQAVRSPTVAVHVDGTVDRLQLRVTPASEATQL